MKKQSSSKSGFINSRNLIALLLCAVGISFATFSVAAKSSSKKLSTSNQRTQSATSSYESFRARLDWVAAIDEQHRLPNVLESA